MRSPEEKHCCDDLLVGLPDLVNEYCIRATYRTILKPVVPEDGLFVEVWYRDHILQVSRGRPLGVYDSADRSIHFVVELNREESSG